MKYKLYWNSKISEHSKEQLIKFMWEDEFNRMVKMWDLVLINK